MIEAFPKLFNLPEPISIYLTAFNHSFTAENKSWHLLKDPDQND